MIPALCQKLCWVPGKRRWLRYGSSQWEALGALGKKAAERVAGRYTKHFERNEEEGQARLSKRHPPLSFLWVPDENPHRTGTPAYPWWERQYGPNLPKGLQEPLALYATSMGIQSHQACLLQQVLSLHGHKTGWMVHAPFQSACSRVRAAQTSSPQILGGYETNMSCPSAPVDFLGSVPVSSSQTGTMGHVSSEEGLEILSWRKDVASENWQVHRKAGVKLRITQVTFWTTTGLTATSETQINANSGTTELYH